MLVRLGIPHPSPENAGSPTQPNRSRLCNSRPPVADRLELYCPCSVVTHFKLSNSMTHKEMPSSEQAASTPRVHSFLRREESTASGRFIWISLCKGKIPLPNVQAMMPDARSFASTSAISHEWAILSTTYCAALFSHGFMSAAVSRRRRDRSRQDWAFQGLFGD